MYYKNSIAVLKLNKIDSNLYLFAVLEGGYKVFRQIFGIVLIVIGMFFICAYIQETYSMVRLQFKNHTYCFGTDSFGLDLNVLSELCSLFGNVLTGEKK